jgi:hypothetical protein
MKRYIGLILLVVAIVSELPMVGSAATKTGKLNLVAGNKPQVSITFGQPRRRRFWRNGRWYYGYRNYGQYRRTQVGAMRYRLVPEYYWVDGIRRVRWVRYYY